MTTTGADRAAIVVFVDHTECRWLRLLRRGFRHCFVVVRRGSSWIVCDPLKGRIELVLLDLPADFDLAAFYAGQGHHVLLGTETGRQPAPAFSLAPLTCVAIVKRIIGVPAPWVLTPRQLFRHLKRARTNDFLWRYAQAQRPSERAASDFILDMPKY